jgi:hypothetical protein
MVYVKRCYLEMQSVGHEPSRNATLPRSSCIRFLMPLVLVWGAGLSHISGSLSSIHGVSASKRPAIVKEKLGGAMPWLGIHRGRRYWPHQSFGVTLGARRVSPCRLDDASRAQNKEPAS